MTLPDVPTVTRKQHFKPEVDVMAKAIDQSMTWCDILRASQPGHVCTEAEMYAIADRLYLKMVTQETPAIPSHEPEPEEPPDPTEVDPGDPEFHE